jgi:2-keto-4-pentenoate hydratase
MDDAVAGRAAALSRAFVSARLAARALEAFPGDLPPTLGEAYRVQSLSIGAWPDDVAGWKIGSTAPAFRDAVGEQRLAGPIFSKNIRSARAGEATRMGVFSGGFAAVEAELLLRLGADASAHGGAATREDALALVASMHIGVEIASSPLRVINDLGPMSIVSDFGNNAGLVVGPEIAGWRDARLEVAARVFVEDVLVGEASAGPIADGPISALQFLIDKCRERSIPLRAGMWVSTGAITGVHEAAPGARARADFGRHGAIDIVLEAIAPSARAAAGG